MYVHIHFYVFKSDTVRIFSLSTFKCSRNNSVEIFIIGLCQAQLWSLPHHKGSGTCKKLATTRPPISAFYKTRLEFTCQFMILCRHPLSCLGAYKLCPAGTILGSQCSNDPIRQASVTHIPPCWNVAVILVSFPQNSFKPGSGFPAGESGAIRNRAQHLKKGSKWTVRQANQWNWHFLY